MTVVRHWNGFAQRGGGHSSQDGRNSEHPDVAVGVFVYCRGDGLNDL